MLNPGVMYMLMSVVLFAVAVVVHYHSKHLSLPISPIISILVVVLPIASFVNAYIYPSLLRTARAAISPSRFQQLSPIILQTLQALVTAVLATLLFEGVVPSQGLNCVLENEWMQLFRAHDGAAIRQIQDTYNCCGLNSVKDRAYPFPREGSSSCAETYDRTVSCRAPWRAAMQATSGVDLGVVLAVGVIQMFGLLLMREGTNWWTASRTSGWKWFMTQRELSRPLLTGPDDGGETAQRQDSTPRGYGSLTDDESGPRVEPSPINERNAWNDQ